MIWVWGSTDDAPIAAVVDALEERSAAFVLLEDAALPALSYDLTLGPEPKGWLEIEGRRLELSAISGVYLRPGTQRPDTATTAAALLSMLQSLPAVVVNRPAAGRSNHAKPFQLAQLAAAGLAIPDTLVTTDPIAARAFLSRHRRIIYKSISGIRSTVAAIDSGDESASRLDRLGHGPVQLQQWIAGQDVRVHVVGERCFATAIQSDATDYRYAGERGRPAELEACELPDALSQRLVALTHGLGLLVSGIDLRRTPSGEWYGFEVNPSPGFTYYEAHTGQPIAAAIAELLANAAQ